MRKIFLIALIILPLLPGCSNLRFPGVYRIDIPQGNFVTDKMLSQLQPGMTEEQVRYVLGVPTLRDPFTPDRWYYLMTYEPGKGETLRQDIIVYFENGVFSRYEGEIAANMKRMTSASSDHNLSKEADQRRRDNAENAEEAEEVEKPAAAPAETTQGASKDSEEADNPATESSTAEAPDEEASTEEAADGEPTVEEAGE